MAASQHASILVRPDPTGPSFSTTLAHGLDVLGAFRNGSGSLSNADLAASTGLSRPTVSRLTYTLAQLGYLKRDARGLSNSASAFWPRPIRCCQP